jgi:hypothetical protein
VRFGTRRSDRIRGAAAAAVVCGLLAVSVLLAHARDVGGIPIVLASAVLAVVVGRWGGRARVRSRPSRRRAIRTSPRATRRRRRRGFLLTASASAAVAVALLRYLGWPALTVMAAVLLSGGTAALAVAPAEDQVRPRRWVALLLLVPLAPVAFSYETALAAPGPDPLSIRSVEWVRDHGGAGIVNGVENWWYTHHPPPVGGTPRELTRSSTTMAPDPTTDPTARTSSPPTTTVPSLPAPATGLAPVASPVQPPLQGEGVWTARAGTPEHPAVATTLVRPDAVHTSIVVGVLRLDPRLTRLALLSGTEQPDGTAPAGGQVPAAMRPTLVAAFNAGFRMKEANGGWFGEGRTAQPLRDGAASLVLRDDGVADVGVWGRDDRMDPHVIGVRQNLALLIDGGRLVPGTRSADSLLWGRTLGHRVLVPRSGIGVTADGALVYVGGPALSIETLALTLQAAGAVRAMELDINNQWVAADTFVPGPGGPLGTKLVDTLHSPADHYLHPQSRDFVAVTTTAPPPAGPS